MFCYPDLGVAVPEILLPDSRVDLSKWAVVACDQFSSQPEYWQQVAEIVGAAPSTYHLILPEIHLGTANESRRIADIHRRMREYLRAGYFTRHEPCLIALRRQTGGRVRRGLMLALDLECYDFKPESGSLIRATEGTVLERIPPRIRIREGAVLELPHVMVLLDDPQDKVWCALGDFSQAVKLYDFELMLGGGRVAGYKFADPLRLAGVMGALRELADPMNFKETSGLVKAPLLFAVGDGNHSLATAKAVWERIKVQSGAGIDLKGHPARYALVEVVNLHDPGLVFEPIHRVMFGVNTEIVFHAMHDYFSRLGMGFSCRRAGEAEISDASGNASALKIHRIGWVSQQGAGCLEVTSPGHALEAGTLQGFIDWFLNERSEVRVDYIHGDEVVAELGRRPGNIGFFLPPMAKQALFKTVIRHGVLPRKTFSMGSAEEKRYYLECREIRD